MLRIEIGTAEDIHDLLEKYGYVRPVVWENDADSYLVKVVEEDELAGFAFVFRREIPAPVGGAKEDFINVIDVMKESLRGQGVGSRMVQLILEKARSEGICQVRAYCDIQNAASHALWMKNGFGISPVRAGKEIVGSYVTYRL